MLFRKLTPLPHVYNDLSTPNFLNFSSASKTSSGPNNVMTNYFKCLKNCTRAWIIFLYLFVSYLASVFCWSRVCLSKRDEEKDDDTGNRIGQFCESSFAQDFVEKNLEKFEQKLLLGRRRQYVERNAAEKDFGDLAPSVQQISLSHDVLLTPVPLDGVS